MKESFGIAFIAPIVILFILLFTGIICLTMNQAKAYGVKDEIITILQNEEIPKYSKTAKYEIKGETSAKISEHLNDAGYRITGKCPSDEWIGYDRNGNKVDKNASYCIKINNISNAFSSDLADKCGSGNCEITSEGYPSMIYYDVVVFYQLDIPALNQFMNFKVYGSTKVLFG